MNEAVWVFFAAWAAVLVAWAFCLYLWWKWLQDRRRS